MYHKVELFREQLGAMLAVDDFGSGYSNELRILNIAPEIIKIDMGLIRDIHKDIDKQVMVSNIIQYSKPRGIIMLAEGVEFEEELKKVIELGIDLVQGYYFSKPEFDLVSIDSDKMNSLKKINRDLGI